jgi:hypothetical protein
MANSGGVWDNAKRKSKVRIFILLIATVLVGLLMGAIASLIWRENKPLVWIVRKVKK